MLKPKKNRLSAFIHLFAVVFLALCCGPRDVEPSYLVVNGRVSDFILNLSADAQQLSLDVQCDREWSCVVEETAASWMAFYRQKDPAQADLWHFMLEVQELEEGMEPRQEVLNFVSGSISHRVIVHQSVPDDMLEVEIPGVYGIRSGTILFNPAKDQISRMQYGNVVSLRLVNPERVRVVTVSGFPPTFQEGSVFSVDFRVMERGITLESAHYVNVAIVKMTDGLAWLKADENIYFILKLPQE